MVPKFSFSASTPLVERYQAVKIAPEIDVLKVCCRQDNVENRGMRVNMNKTKVMISGERQKEVQKAVRWPCGVCGRGVGSNSVQYISCQKWVGLRKK